MAAFVALMSSSCVLVGNKWKPQLQCLGKKILWFLSVSFGAGTSTKGKYAELLSWLANLSANFFLEG